MGPPGPDPAFPFFGADNRIRFPDPARCKGSIIAVGGNLSPGMLLSAYEQGIFPWYNPEDPVIWQSPPVRFVIFPEKLHVSESMRKILRQRRFDIRFDTDFPDIIRSCAEMYRPGQGGTWITEDIIAAYTELYRLGYVHCAGAWTGGDLASPPELSSPPELVGGCYGIALGNCFFGESMFARKPNASKAAFLTLARSMFGRGIAFVDCQVPTDHLRSLGGEEMPRSGFLELLAANLGGRDDARDRRGSWAGLAAAVDF